MTTSDNRVSPLRETPPVIGARTVLYAACGLLLGGVLTAGGYLVDYHALYDELPSAWSVGLLRGLHDVTPVHYFADLFAIILALVGGLAGWFQDRVIYYSRNLERLVEIRTRDLQKSQDEILHLVLHDSVTDLPNRTSLLDRLERALGRARRRNASVAILYVGIDRFRAVNESLGHGVGDSLLALVGERLSTELASFKKATSSNRAAESPSGAVFRVEGDEFVVLLDRARSLRDATRLADGILESLAGPVRLGDREVVLSLSVGIAAGPGSYNEAGEILRDARTAMGRAKIQGRGRYEVFDREMLRVVEDSLHLETELHQALEAGQLRLWYQPVCRIGSGALIGFEALVRWEHPARGVIPPGRFIPLAEETGLIVQMSRWLFSDAFRQVRQWQERYGNKLDLSMNMNLSPKYLFHPDLESDLGRLLDETGADPSRFHLEITEGSFIDRPRAVTAVLERLKAWGFRIAIDDFGTGFSSLSMLTELPVDILKVDRQFVSRLGDDEDARKIVGTILGLARKLDLDVVAEGIETEQQLEELRTMRCRYGQGFLLGKPTRVEEAERLLESCLPGVRKRRARAS